SARAPAPRGTPRQSPASLRRGWARGADAPVRVAVVRVAHLLFGGHGLPPLLRDAQGWRRDLRAGGCLERGTLRAVDVDLVARRLRGAVLEVAGRHQHGCRDAEQPASRKSFHAAASHFPASLLSRVTLKTLRDWEWKTQMPSGFMKPGAATEP